MNDSPQPNDIAPAGVAPDPAVAPSRLPRNVLLLGLVSLFTDAASEMVFPFLPFFLTGVLLASPATVGWIEGLADALSSLLKLFAGRLADRLGRNKPLVLAGYTLSSAARPLVGLAASPFHVLVVRLLDRTGKGLRSSPRDAIIAASTPTERHGTAFGFHRAMDHTGAALGPVLALLVFATLTTDLRTLFLLAAIPGAVSVLVLLAVREPPAAPAVPEPEAPATPSWTKPPRPLRNYLLAVGAMALGRPNEALLLPALGAGRVSLEAVPVLWLGLHVVKVVFSLLGGRLADAWGHRALVGIGWAVHALVFVGLACVDSRELAFALFLAWGIAPGLSEGAEKALVGARADPGGRATAFGWYHLVVGLGTLPASVMFGTLWQVSGAPVAYAAGAVAAALGLGLLAFAGPTAR